MKNRILTLFIGIAAAFGMQAQEYTTYLFAYFSGNWPDGEQVRYALSDDGYNYHALNYGRPVVASDTIALKRSVRDPHILRAEDGKTFFKDEGRSVMNKKGNFRTRQGVMRATSKSLTGPYEVASSEIILFILVVSRRIPPSIATAAPTSPVPLPRTVTGIFLS